MRRWWIALAVAMAAAAPAAARAHAQTTGTLVVVNGGDATVSLVDLERREITATVPVGDAPREVAVSPDGRWALVSNYGAAKAPGATLSLVDIANGVVERTISLGAHRRPHGLAWLANGTVLVTSESDSALLVLDASSWAVRAAIPLGQGAPYLVAVDSSERTAYVSNVTSSSVTAVDLSARRALKSAAVPKSADGVAPRPASDEVWVTSPQSDRVSVLGAADLAPRGRVESESYPVRVRFTPDGALALVVCAKSSELKFVDAAKREERASVAMRVSIAALHGGKGAEGYETHTVPLGLAVSPDGAWAFVTLGAVDALAVVSVRTLEIETVIFVGHEPDGVALSRLVRAPSE